MAWSGNRFQKLLRLARTFATNPVTVSRALPGELRQWYQWHWQRPPLTRPNDISWNEQLHGLLGAPWPCPIDQRFAEVMVDIAALLEAKGWGFGRDTYAWYADGDRALCSAAWCVVVHTRPGVVIETGVAHGVTTRTVLEALKDNRHGRLWSIDLPFPFDRRLHSETGTVVTHECRARWSYLEGASKQRLPQLTAELGRADLFIHDSLHTAENTLFEMEQVASVMSPGGVMLIDDINSHGGFATFAERNPSYRTILCSHATRDGIFGVAVNSANA